MSVDVRRIEASEWPLLRRMRLAALADSPAAFGQRLEVAAAQPDSEWISFARAASRGSRRAWFIARIGGREVGIVQGRRRSPGDCLVFSMWVDPTARRGGVGRALLAAIDGWARSWGGDRVVLWVTAGNHGALGFYRQLGFELIETGPDADSGAHYGALAMTRPISPSSTLGH